MYAVKKASGYGSSFFVRAKWQTRLLFLLSSLHAGMNIVLSVGLPLVGDNHG